MYISRYSLLLSVYITEMSSCFWYSCYFWLRAHSPFGQPRIKSSIGRCKKSSYLRLSLHVLMDTLWVFHTTHVDMFATDIPIEQPENKLERLLNSLFISAYFTQDMHNYISTTSSFM